MSNIAARRRRPLDVSGAQAGLFWCGRLRLVLALLLLDREAGRVLKILNRAEDDAGAPTRLGRR
jgi:hypothetical protein